VDSMQGFGRHLRSLRESRGFDRQDIRSDSGVSISRQFLLEAGQSLSDTDGIRKIASALHHDPDALVALRDSAVAAARLGRCHRN
jgi:transcriptional regulator with XRE-family HTH domain